ncbi:hypothetical protein [Mesorhizobium sp. L-8-10]|uniref:hypothetical protein n=1 Tax=Mesorhizobium sp. L-8-10 TaxID=2744523 RepID=UPI001928D21D|nr:hypothetical protein [Mesorhizobium sp. L-8-10]
MSVVIPPIEPSPALDVCNALWRLCNICAIATKSRTLLSVPVPSAEALVRRFVETDGVDVTANAPLPESVQRFRETKTFAEIKEPAAYRADLGRGAP